MKTFSCDCGETHDVSDDIAWIIDVFGKKIRVTTLNGTWWVPRIWLAVHGLKAMDLASLAFEHGWKRERSKTT